MPWPYHLDDFSEMRFRAASATGNAGAVLVNKVREGDANERGHEVNSGEVVTRWRSGATMLLTGVYFFGFLAVGTSDGSF